MAAAAEACSSQTVFVSAKVWSQLLAAGDEVSPRSEDEPRKHLHTLLAMQSDPISESEDEEGILSDPEATSAQEERLEARVKLLKEREGIRSERTLRNVFKLLDCLIGQYKLNRTDVILQEVRDVCKELGGNWHIKAIQSLAFCRWKQYRFKEALTLFLEQQSIMGASAALCENIGHTYSSLGDLDKAEEYFERAVELLKRGSFGNRGGIYMGLGLVRDRLGRTKEALPILQQALEHYQQEHTRDYAQLDASIIAKAHMSVGKAHEKLGDAAAAAKHMSEALRIFKATVGDTSPLTAHALAALGKVRASQGPQGAKEALKLLRNALTLEVAKDAFHLETVWDLLNTLKDLQMSEVKAKQEKAEREGGGGREGTSGARLATLQALYGQYLPLVHAARSRLTDAHERDDVGTLAVFFKTAGEVCLLAQEYDEGKELLHEALRLLGAVPNFDCRSLIEGCTVLLNIAEANAPKPKQANSAAASTATSTAAAPSLSPPENAASKAKSNR